MSRFFEIQQTKVMPQVPPVKKPSNKKEDNSKNEKKKLRRKEISSRKKSNKLKKYKKEGENRMLSTKQRLLSRRN